MCDLATAVLAEEFNCSSAAVGPEVDEFCLAQRDTAACRLVRPPRVAASPAALGCKVNQIIHLRDRDSRNTNRHLVLGDVVGIHIDDSYLQNGLFDTVRATPLARCGYRDYASVTSVFQMLRPGEVE